MRCTRCDGACANDQFYDRVDERGGNMVAVSSVPNDRQSSMPMFQMF